MREGKQGHWDKRQTDFRGRAKGKIGEEGDNKKDDKTSQMQSRARGPQLHCRTLLRCSLCLSKAEFETFL